MGKSKLSELGIAPGSKIMLLGRQHNPQNDEIIQKINKVDTRSLDYFILLVLKLIDPNLSLSIDKGYGVGTDPTLTNRIFDPIRVHPLLYSNLKFLWFFL